MNKETYLAIECKFGNITPWTVIYRTSNLDDLIHTYNYLTKEDNPEYFYRCACFSKGFYCPIKI